MGLIVERTFLRLEPAPCPSKNLPFSRRPIDVDLNPAQLPFAFVLSMGYLSFDETRRDENETLTVNAFERKNESLTFGWKKSFLDVGDRKRGLPKTKSKPMDFERLFQK